MIKPTLVDEPPTGYDWIHEIKHDGYRTLLFQNSDRNGRGGLEYFQ